MAKQSGIERYKDSLIAGSAIRNFATGFDWYSQGTIFRRGQLGSIVEIRRIWGMIFNSKEAAEQTALSCAKIGLTSGLDAPPSQRYRSLGGKIVCDRQVRHL